MTVQELIDELEMMDPNAEVRLAMQPSWPFEYSIDQIAEVSVVNKFDEEVEKKVLYLSEGSQLGYLPGHVGEELGW